MNFSHRLPPELAVLTETGTRELRPNALSAVLTETGTRDFSRVPLELRPNALSAVLTETGTRDFSRVPS
jgi:stalled ribosome alternative rescue factor ArfA